MSTYLYPLAFVLLVLCAPPATAQITITYDEFAQLSRNEQVEQFQTLSAENMALIARTQAERWLAWNREGLTEKQIKVLNEVITMIEPSLYEEKNADMRDQTVQQISEQLLAVLPKEEAGRCCGAGAPYIPPFEQ
ncbi:MAG TPA: hypothetical protein VKP65_09260 [Rhodothermales bacterium]|nr:hypothetical protein [Rhodothermales bacterium]